MNALAAAVRMLVKNKHCTLNGKRLKHHKYSCDGKTVAVFMNNTELINCSSYVSKKCSDIPLRELYKAKQFMLREQIDRWLLKRKS